MMGDDRIWSSCLAKLDGLDKPLRFFIDFREGHPLGIKTAFQDLENHNKISGKTYCHDPNKARDI
jgi:hypothetical protein